MSGESQDETQVLLLFKYQPAAQVKQAFGPLPLHVRQVPSHDGQVLELKYRSEVHVRQFVAEVTHVAQFVQL